MISIGKSATSSLNHIRRSQAPHRSTLAPNFSGTCAMNYFASLLLTVASVVTTVYGQTLITVDNGETQGDFAPMEFCPPGSHAIGFATQQDEANVPVVDNTATSSVALICNDAAQSNVTSFQG